MIANQENTPTQVKVSRKGRKAELVEQVKESIESAQHAVNRSLTRAQRATLEVLLDPTKYLATDAERAKAAGVSLRRYYEIKADPAFKQMQQDFVRSMLRDRIAPVIAASLETAGKAGRDGTMERNMLFQMAELHTPKRTVDQHVTGQVAVGIVGINPSDV